MAKLQRDHPVVRMLESTITILMVLLAVGLLIRPLQEPAWAEVQAGQPELNLEKLEAAAGQGALVGLLGGFRSLIADFTWIKAYTLWEKRDRAKVESLINLTTTIDPRPTYFWTNGAHIIAYDMPTWRLAKINSRFNEIPADVRAKINKEQAMRGIQMLDRAMQYHPDDARVVLDKALIHLNRLDDPAVAVTYLREAAAKPNAPYFINRIVGELLRNRLDDPEGALEHYKALYPTLPDDDPSAYKGIVYERIQELEAQLNSGRSD